MSTLDPQLFSELQTIESICKSHGCRIDYKTSDVLRGMVNIVGGTDEQQIDCAEALGRLLGDYGRSKHTQ